MNMPTNNASQPTAVPTMSHWLFMSRLASDQVFYAVALFQQLAQRRLHFFAAEIVDGESLNYAVFAVLAGHRIRIDHTFRYSVAAIRGHRHAHPVAGGRAEHPIMNVIQGRRRRRGRG